MKLLSKKSQLKRNRIKFIAAAALICLVALAFIISNFRDNIVFFYSPSELSALKIPEQKIIRVGGLVKENSVKDSANNLEFVITDYKADLKIHYSGIKPDLFREKQGMVAKGIWDQKNNVFIASEILTKHDEKYMPPEVAKAIKKNAEYQKSHP
ncbi:MAG: cytochrome c maturation protein CcmE [Pseudomonadota bacterium]